MSVAQLDKRLLDIEQQIELTEKQLKEDYRQLQRAIKENPHLQAALNDYKTYFAAIKIEKEQQIKALSALIRSMEHLPTAKTDILDLKREIKYIKQK